MQGLRELVKAPNNFIKPESEPEEREMSGLMDRLLKPDNGLVPLQACPSPVLEGLAVVKEPRINRVLAHGTRKRHCFGVANQKKASALSSHTPFC